jgi:hypothetical protein
MVDDTAQFYCLLLNLILSGDPVADRLEIAFLSLATPAQLLTHYGVLEIVNIIIID